MDIDTDCTIETLFPTGIPDEAAYILCEVMRELSFICESRYYVHLKRYHDARRALFQAEQPHPGDDHHPWISRRSK